MIANYAEMESVVTKYLDDHGYHLSERALKPLKAIHFADLVDIYDHEESFLRGVFLSSIIEAQIARTGTSSIPSSDREVTLEDIRTAMLMLGAAVASASEIAFSRKSKSKIKDICPYCISAVGSMEEEGVMIE